MKLTKEEKKIIEEAARWLYKVSSEIEEIYGKDEFFERLKHLIGVTPIIGGYAKSNQLLTKLINITN